MNNYFDQFYITCEFFDLMKLEHSLNKNYGSSLNTSEKYYR